MSFDAAGDLCLGFFKDAYDAGAIRFPRQARVLELGCAEADWQGAMKQARPDLHLTGIDQRGEGRPACDRLIQADFLSTDAFTDQEFDVIVACSVLTWAGRGHYGDPKQDDGDAAIMRRCRRWIKPTGCMYFDVPYVCAGKPKRKELLRIFDDALIETRLLQGRWKEVWRQHFPGYVDDQGHTHPDGPYVALVVEPI